MSKVHALGHVSDLEPCMIHQIYMEPILGKALCGLNTPTKPPNIDAE